MTDRAHLFPTYAPPSPRFVRGEGCWLFTAAGERALDCISGIAVTALGHANPRLVEALKVQSEQLWHLSNMFDISAQEELAEAYCQDTFADRVFFTNSGTEAVECALKTARRFHYDAGDGERLDIITFEGAFHGRSYAAMNAGGNPKYLEGYGPALPGYRQIPFNDIEAARAAVDARTAGVLTEPIQGEGGVRAAAPEFLRGLRDICDERGALLIYDEVQCGAGRTGKLFAHQWVEGAEPDIMAAAKGLGGGFPMGACLATQRVAQSMVFGSHGTTFGGNPLAMAVGLAVWSELTETDLLDRVVVASNRFRAGLEALRERYPDAIAEVRGAGLLLGLRMTIPNVAVRDRARAAGLLVGVAGDNVVRLAPPLVISTPDIDHALEVLGTVLSEVVAEAAVVRS